MEKWQRAWRDGIAPQLSRPGLEALRLGLVADDPALLQGQTCEPPPLDVFGRDPIRKACAVAYCGWKGDDQGTVDEVMDYFHHIISQATATIGHAELVEEFMDWFDDTPRQEMRRLLLAEVERELERRRAIKV